MTRARDAQRRSAASAAVRRAALLALVVLAAPWLAVPALAAVSGGRNALAYQSIQALQQAMTSGRLTSAALVRFYLERIQALDRRGPSLHAIIAVNPDALAEARALDAKRSASGAPSLLYGIPVLIKDNIETQDRMPTTAGSYALANNFAVHDAPVVAALRAAGAVILGKTNLSEWADFRSSRSTSGWSALGGLTRNPYVLDRTACGSSSGSAVAVATDMAPASVGTETDGSIVCPASVSGIVGLKPTVGLLSQHGIVPVAHSQDTAGPMGRSVADVAILLTAMTAPSPQCASAPSNGPASSSGPAPSSSPAPPSASAPPGTSAASSGSAPSSASAPPGCHAVNYVAALDANALEGKRIGVLPLDTSNPELGIVYDNALDRLRAAGATLIEVPSPDLAPIEAAEGQVLLTEFKVDLDRYLAGANPAVTVRSLSQLIRFDRASLYEMELFGQNLFLAADSTSGLDDPLYRAALEKAKRLAGAQGIDRLLREHHLDLLVAPTAGPAWRVDIVYGDRAADVGASTTLAAVAGYPDLTVPMGEVRDLPVGLSFIGPAWSESLLLACGYAFSLRSPPLPAPQFLPSLEGREFAPGNRY